MRLNLIKQTSSITWSNVFTTERTLFSEDRLEK